MGNIVSSVYGAVGGAGSIASKGKKVTKKLIADVTPKPPPPPTPLPDESFLRVAKRRAIAKLLGRGGRLSTILGGEQSDILGG